MKLMLRDLKDVRSVLAPSFRFLDARIEAGNCHVCVDVADAHVEFLIGSD
jgi:hypothetical protein